MKLINKAIKNKLGQQHNPDSTHSRNQSERSGGLRVHASNDGWVFNKEPFRKYQEEVDFLQYKSRKKEEEDVFQIPLIPCSPSKKLNRRSKSRNRRGFTSFNSRQILTERRKENQSLKNLKKRIIIVPAKPKGKMPSRRNKSVDRKIFRPYKPRTSFDDTLSSRRYSSVSRPKSRSLNRDKAKIICFNNKIVRRISNASSLEKDTLLKAPKQKLKMQIREQYFG